MIRVRIFSNPSKIILADKLNVEIKEYEKAGYKVKDIKFSSAYYETAQEMDYSVMIIMEK